MTGLQKILLGYILVSMAWGYWLTDQIREPQEMPQARVSCPRPDLSGITRQMKTFDDKLKSIDGTLKKWGNNF